MTSNLGSEHIQKMQTIGFTNASSEQEYVGTKEKVMESLKKFFRPEFLNRIDDVIVFDVLAQSVIADIVHIQLERVRERLKMKDMKFELTPEALVYMAEKGYDPQFGARPLKRLIQDEILNKIANSIIKGDLKNGQTVIIDKNEAGLVLIDTDKKSKKITLVKKRNKILQTV
jgi:ATP-dependent Clp protease ATP-binding subunit ClpA